METLVACILLIRNHILSEVTPPTTIFIMTGKVVPSYFRLNLFLILIFSLDRIDHFSWVAYECKNLNLIGYHA